MGGVDVAFGDGCLGVAGFGLDVGHGVSGGGFVAPFGFGIIKEQTGSVVPGLFALAAASTVAAILVYFLKERKPASDVAEKASAPEATRMEP